MLGFGVLVGLFVGGIGGALVRLGRRRGWIGEEFRDDGDTVTAYLPHTELTWDRATNTVDGTRYFTHTG
ncbi:MAG TPA: hypothetical protein VKZ67_01965, partial [Natronosporangium sp.]|nr:hypothetical protein [Natronosporangium sp.]